MKYQSNFPRLISDDSTDGVLRNTKHIRKVALIKNATGIKLSNFGHLIPCEFRHGILFASRQPPRTGPGAVPITPSNTLWAKNGVMIFSALQSLRVEARSISVSECPALRMKAKAVLIPSGATPLPEHVLHIIGVGSKPKMVGVDAKTIIARVADEKPARDWPLVDRVRKPMREVLYPANLESSISEIADKPRPFPASAFSFNKFLIKIPSLLGGQNNLARKRSFISGIFSGIHNTNVSIVRAFGSLITAPTLAPI